MHGANRLGTNSLLDLLVFGRAAGNHLVASQLARAGAPRRCRRTPPTSPRRAWPGSTRAPAASTRRTIANDLRKTMQQHAGVFRTQASMDEGVGKVQAIAERAWSMHLADKSKIFNTARVEALEVDNLMESALATMISAAARRECRGAHTVADYERPIDDPVAPNGRNDAEWMKHTLWYSEGNRLDYKPVNLTAADRRVDPAQGAHVLTWTTNRHPPSSPPSSRSAPTAPTVDACAPSRSTATTPRTAPRRRCRRCEVELDGSERMLLDALMKLKAIDPSLSFRRSCREGVCGSDAMNINGKNGLACLTNMRTLKDPIVLKPLPGLPVIRDLIVDMTQFFKQYHSIKPYLINDELPPEKERLQSPEERDELNGLYECILCASCSTACPSFWWNPDKFVGPAGLLQAYRFIADSRDEATGERLDNLEDPYRLFRCHTIMNCVDVCPKSLNPTRAIGKIKELMVRRAV